MAVFSSATATKAVDVAGVVADSSAFAHFSERASTFGSSQSGVSQVIEERLTRAQFCWMIWKNDGR